MERFICLLILISVQSTIQQQFSLQQPFAAVPSDPCVGDVVTITCKVMFTDTGSTPMLTSAVITRDGENIRIDTSNHRILRSSGHVIGVIINTTADDDAVEYTCTATGAPPDFVFSLILNVTDSPMTATITGTTLLSNRLFTVNWTITDSDYNYIITLTNLCTNVIDNYTVSENTNSYNVTGLTGSDDYNVSVTTNNSCGMMMSDPITVYDFQISTPMNIIVNDITRESFVVQWNAVTQLDIYYSVRWYGEDGSNGMANVTGTLHPVNGLTNNTSYNVTVAAIYCGEVGPASNVVNVTTNNVLPSSTSSSTPVPTSAGGNNNTSDDDDDDSSIGAIVGGIVGGIAAVIVVVVIIIVVYFCYCRGKDSTDDTQGLKSPTSTGGTHTASIKPAVNVPHQTAASGEEYAVTTKVPTTTKPQQPTEEYAMVDKAKKHAAATQGIHYADLQGLPASGNKPPTNQGPTSTYAMVA